MVLHYLSLEGGLISLFSNLERKDLIFNMKIGAENFKIFKDKVEFDLGSFMIITGPNGSGKSTLIELINW